MADLKKLAFLKKTLEDPPMSFLIDEISLEVKNPNSYVYNNTH